MRRGHRGGRGGCGRGHQRSLRRFGGFNPLKAIAVLGGIVIGGVIAAGVVGLLTLVLTVIGLATAGISWLLSYGWIIAALLIYHAIRSRQRQPQQPPHVPDAAWNDEPVEAEYRARVEQSQAPSADERTGRAGGGTGRNVATSVAAVAAGLALALGANAGVSALNLPPLANTLLPPLAGAVSGLGVYAALRRWVMPPIDDWEPSSYEVRSQVKRIRGKARKLANEASEAGGVFNGLDDQAGRLAEEASQLAQRVFELRRIARDVRQKMDEAASDSGASAPDATSSPNQVPDTGQRLRELLGRNHAAQERCLAQIARIEDLLDVARLEVVCPEESPRPDPAREELVQEVETELEAARRALEEVRRQSATI